MSNNIKTMRDSFIEALYDEMHKNERIFFLSADFGAPALDQLKNTFPERFINVGIAEQNLINISTGLALEGYIVYAYAIAAFITMRCYEQLRVNLAILSQLRKININLIGVGAGFSYDVSGPSHHCLEDISIMRTLPNIEIFSPSDHILAKHFAPHSLKNNYPKYIRMDSKPNPSIYNNNDINIIQGFKEIREGESICIISTGFMTQKAIRIADKLIDNGINIGIIDFFLLSNFNNEILVDVLKKYNHIITLEEGFINRAGLDNLIKEFLYANDMTQPITSLGLKNSYSFEMGTREKLHQLNGIGEDDIIEVINKMNSDR